MHPNPPNTLAKSHAELWFNARELEPMAIIKRKTVIIKHKNTDRSDNMKQCL